MLHMLKTIDIFISVKFKDLFSNVQISLDIINIQLKQPSINKNNYSLRPAFLKALQKKLHTAITLLAV